MCEFISWIEKDIGRDKKILFLTYDQIYNTPRGEILRGEVGSESPQDFYGHAAIRKYFDFLEGGMEKECSDFSSPANFPDVISKAIKMGEFRGFILPAGLLRKPLDDRYQADLKSLDDRYRADRKSLGDKYEADRKPLDDRYRADRKSLGDRYWDLFAIEENRTEAWRKK